MKIDCYIDAKTFKDFTFYNVIKRMKGYKTPLKFSSVMLVLSILCLLFIKHDKALTFALVLFGVAIFTPICYFATFFYSVNKQIKLHNLTTPRFIYSIKLEEGGVTIEKDDDEVTTSWEDIYQVSYAPTCIYLFINKQRAFLLPHESIKDVESAKALIEQKCKDKVVVLK